jgi:hypothetical protein
MIRLRPISSTAETACIFTARIGRGGKIRTCDPLRPRQVRYQAALRPDNPLLNSRARVGSHLSRMSEAPISLVGATGIEPVTLSLEGCSHGVARIQMTDFTRHRKAPQRTTARYEAFFTGAIAGVVGVHAHR